MLKKSGLWLAAGILILLQSCSVNTETTYYKDAATSMESSILIDQGMMGMLKMLGTEDQTVHAVPDLQQITTEWKSLYDMQKDGKVVLNEKEVGALKKMFVKLDKNKGEILGISLKSDKLQPEEIAELFAHKKELKSIPLQDIAQWNGSKLEIDTEKFQIAETLYDLQKPERTPLPKPKTKSDSVEAYGRQMADGMLNLMKMVNGNFTHTLKFQRPIQKIVGKHDFVEQLDDRTIRVNVRTADLWDEDKKLKNKDKKIVVHTK